MTVELGMPPPITIKGEGNDESEDVFKKLIRIGIDKIRIRMDFASSKDAEYVQIREWAKSVRRNEFGNKHSVWSKLGISQTCVSQRLDGGGTLFIRYGKHRGRFRAWFEFNPSKVVIAELEGRICTMLEKGMYSLFERGIVTYCEFAIDVPGAQIEDFVFLSRTHRQQDLGWIGNGGIYIGSRKHGELYFHIYDKQRQLREAENTEVVDSWLRIEARLSGKRRFPLCTILQLPSPFSSLLVLRRSCVEQFIDDGLLGDLFAVNGDPHEIQYQVSFLDGQKKKIVIDRLNNSEVEWWRPDVLWGRLRESLGWMAEGVSYSGWA